MAMQNINEATQQLAALIDRLRPPTATDAGVAERRVRSEAVRLAACPADARRLCDSVAVLLGLPRQGSLYAEAGVRSALGFWLELWQRIGQRILPLVPDDSRLHSILSRIFVRADDHLWVAAVADEAWLALVAAIGGDSAHGGDPASVLFNNLRESVRLLSYRLAGAALDRELLRAEPQIETHDSPFLAQNAALLPLLEQARVGAPVAFGDVDAVYELLQRCDAELSHIRLRAREKGISIRLTYQLSRLEQISRRLRRLLDILSARDDETRLRRLVGLMKILVRAEQSRDGVAGFVRDDLSLLARNVVDHASRHGEHYIAENRREWWAMCVAAGGGGIIIALMAIVKMRLALLHLPPLTEGVVYGLNYGLGFVLIHLLGFSVATKQPAMTAASIAATLDETRPGEWGKLVDLAQNVVRTQFISVVGNVFLALPVACLAAWAWFTLAAVAVVPDAKAVLMLKEMIPVHSGVLFFAAVAGVGLFLSGLVSGYFDNQARYHDLGPRIAVAPLFSPLGAQGAAWLGDYLDKHYGAIIGNLFFGMYLGMMGAMDHLTGLPLDIRHVAFSSANLGAALAILDAAVLRELLPWAVAGVISIALVNLVVSFSLALYVAMQSRGMGAKPVFALGLLVVKRFAREPLAFFTPPPR